MSEIGRGHAFTLLELHGDVLEQLATRATALAPAVASYAALWANHVLPAREKDNPAFVAGPLKDLAELSYSALLRLLSGHVAAQRVIDASTAILEAETAFAPALLAAQEGLFSFFSNTGAAVELVNKAGERVKTEIFHVPDETWGSGGWFYERRSGYVHERVAPVFVHQGLLGIDATLLTEKHVVWSKTLLSARELSGLVEELVVAAGSALAAGWERLHDAVRKTNPPKTLFVAFDQQFSSASPRSGG